MTFCSASGREQSDIEKSDLRHLEFNRSDSSDLRSSTDDAMTADKVSECKGKGRISHVKLGTRNQAKHVQIPSKFTLVDFDMQNHTPKSTVQNLVPTRLKIEMRRLCQVIAQ